MSNNLNFNILKQAWKKLIRSNITSILKVAPGFDNPQNVFLKNMKDSSDSLEVKFGGFESAVKDTRDVQSAKRVIIDWLKKISISVQIIPSTPTELYVRISKDLKFSEDIQPVVVEKPIKENKYPLSEKKLVNIVRSNLK